MFNKKEYNKQYAKDNREKYNEYSRKWRKNNPEKARNYDKQRDRERRKYLQEYKLLKGCSVCGYNKCANALDFHHDGDKDFTISNTTKTSIDKLKREMDKCIVICCRCHRELHDKEKHLEGKL